MSLLATEINATGLNMANAEVLCGTWIPSRAGAYAVQPLLSNLPQPSNAIITIRLEHTDASDLVYNYRAALWSQAKNANTDTTFGLVKGILQPVYMLAGEKLKVYVRTNDAGATNVSANLSIICADGASAV